MATTKPRITITLEPDHHLVVRRLADLQGTSMSKVITQFFGEVVPILSEVADTLEIAQRASSDARAKFVRNAEAAQEELRPLAQFALDQFDMFAEKLSSLAETQTPEPVITGVTKSAQRGKPRKPPTSKVHRKGGSDAV